MSLEWKKRLKKSSSDVKIFKKNPCSDVLIVGILVPGGIAGLAQSQKGFMFFL